MRAPVYGVADFLSALQNLLPRGRAWNTELTSVQGKVEAGLVSTTRQVNLVDAQLLDDAFPATANFLLPEWEAALGLPDPCAGAGTTISERQAQVITRFTDSGGQSAARFIALAAQLGYEITTTMFAPFRAGHSRAGDELGGPWSFFTWQINAPYVTATYFRAGSGHAGDPLASWGNAVLECAMEERAPAHTDLGFTYGQEIPEGLGVNFVDDYHYARPIGGQPTVGPFTTFWPFTRNSTATYRHVGEIRYANENLLLRSQELNQGGVWPITRATVSADVVTSPIDDTLTADKLVEDVSVTNTHFVGQPQGTQPGRAYTASIYAKDAGRRYVKFTFGKSGAPFTRGGLQVDLQTGAFVAADIGTPAYVANRQVDPVGNGWYRISLTVIIDATSTDGYVEVRLFNGVADAYTGDGVSGVYLTAAQLQRGTIRGNYLVTTTTPKFDQPRIEFDGAAACRGLISEITATNMCLWSEDFSNANWAQLNLGAVVQNAINSPDGTPTADKIVEDGATGAHRTRPVDLTITANGSYTLSVFVRAAERSFFSLRFAEGTFTNYVEAYFDLTNGTVISAAAFGAATGAVGRIVEDFGNGWYRVSLSGAINGGTTTGRFLFEINNVSAGLSYAGTVGSGVYVWGAQIEAGLFATSYMPTSTAAAVRDADVVNRPLGAEFSAIAGTVVVEGTASPGQSSAGAQFVWIISDLTSNERVSLVRPVSSDIARWNVIDGGAASASMDTTFTNRAAFKHAAAWAVDDFAMSFNGAPVTTDNVGTLPTMTHFQLGAHGLASQGNCHIKKFTYYPLRKTNAFLEAAAA